MKKFLFFALLLGVDQALKIFSLSNLLPELGGFFKQPSVCNPFMSFGIELHAIWFWLLWMLAFSFLLFLFQTSAGSIWIVLALAGTISNFIDRLRLDCVVDFIQLGPFPTFNPADVMISLGIGVFLWKNFFKKTFPQDPHFLK